MKEHRLSFCTIFRVEDRIDEIITDADVEITIEQVNELQDYFSKVHDGEYAALVNRKNPYTYTFEAQRALGKHPGLIAIAMVVQTDSAKGTAEYLLKPRSNMSSIASIFDSRDEALAWLREKLAARSGEKNR